MQKSNNKHKRHQNTETGIQVQADDKSIQTPQRPHPNLCVLVYVVTVSSATTHNHSLIYDSCMQL